MPIWTRVCAHTPTKQRNHMPKNRHKSSLGRRHLLGLCGVGALYTLFAPHCCYCYYSEGVSQKGGKKKENWNTSVSVYVGENERRRNRSLRRRRKQHYGVGSYSCIYKYTPRRKKREDKRRKNVRVQGDIKIFPGSHLVAVCTVVCL